MITCSRATTRTLSFLLLGIVAGLVLVPGALAAGATRTWVSGLGDDANPCSRSAPCKTLAGAIAKTADGGEINAIDSGGFGAVTITKSITIDLRGVQGSILHSGSSGIIINNANADVTIRNVSIQGGGIDPTPAPPACPYSMNSTGIRIVNARSVRLQSVDIVSERLAGIRIDAAASTPVVTASDVSVNNVCGPAIQAVTTNVASGTSVLLDGASLTHAATGILASGNMDVQVARTTIADTDVALDVTAPATVRSLGLNLLAFNDVDGAFTDGVAGLLPPVEPTPVTVNPTPVTVTPTPVTVQSVIERVQELIVALADGEFEGTAGKPVKLRYVSTAKGEATLTIRSGRKVVAELDAPAARGRNLLTWNGKLDGKAAAPGRYRVELSVVGADGQTDSDTAVVELARPPKGAPGAANGKPKPGAAKPRR